MIRSHSGCPCSAYRVFHPQPNHASLHSLLPHHTAIEGWLRRRRMLSSASSRTFSSHAPSAGIDAAANMKSCHTRYPVHAQFVENIVFIDTSAPDAQHVHVHGRGVVDRLLVDGARDARQEDVAGDVVGSFGEERLAVEFEVEGRAVGDLVAHEAQRAQPMRVVRLSEASPPRPKPGIRRDGVRPVRGSTRVSERQCRAGRLPC